MNQASSQQLAQGSSVSLGVRMLAAFSLVMVISAVVVTLFVGHILRETSLFEKGEQFTRYADSLAQRINTDLENLSDEIALRANNIFHVGLTKDLPTLQRNFERLQNIKPEYAWIGYANREGHVLAATGGLLVGETLASLPWFQSALQGPTLSDRSRAGALSQPEVGQPLRFIDLAHPVRNERGETLGIVVAHLGLRWFETLLHPIPSATPDTGEALQTVITRGVRLIVIDDLQFQVAGLPVRRAAEGIAGVELHEMAVSQNREPLQREALREAGEDRAVGRADQGAKLVPAHIVAVGGCDLVREGGLPGALFRIRA